MSDEDSDEAGKALVEAGFSPKSGAREIERKVKEWITKGMSPLLKDVRKLTRDSVVFCRWKEGKLLFEIAKCVVLCSNCHRKVHAGILDIHTPVTSSVF